MKYTIDQVIAEIGNAREHADKARETFQEVWNEYVNTEETGALDEKLAQADYAKAVCNLYLKCLFEMSAKILTAALCEAWTEPKFLKKWEGTPWHYKRLRSTLEACGQKILPEGSSVYIWQSERETWAAPGLKVYCNVPGDAHDRGTLLLDAYVPYAIAPCSEKNVRVFQLIEGDAAPTAPDFPSFEDILDACGNAYASKREREKILDDAISTARELAAQRSLGFTTLRKEIEDRHYEI